MSNHNSVKPSSHIFDLAQEQIQKEIDLGNYIKVNYIPDIVSPFGAIPKDDGSVHIIHDCSLPEVGSSVNGYAKLEEKIKYQSIDDAVALLGQGYWMAKLDLKSAYRSVGISINSQRVTGLHWQINKETVYFIDNKLPFGSKLAPFIFDKLSQAVRRIMAGKGFNNLVSYLDDFLCVSDSKEGCMTMLKELVNLVRKLGFSINYNKVMGPCKVITFLGVEIDTNAMVLRLPQDKLEKCRHYLGQFNSRKRVTKRQTQRLIGFLSWASGVVTGGRVYLHNLHMLCKGLSNASSRVVVPVAVRSDLDWWQSCLCMFNGKSAWLDRLPITSVFTDACGNGAGGVFQSDWFYCNWAIDWPMCKDLHINQKEILAIVLAAWRWAPFWYGKKILVNTDNMVAVAAINKARSSSPLISQSLRCLFWLSVYFNFSIKAVHIPGHKNDWADGASRLDQFDRRTSFLSLFSMYDVGLPHMSEATSLYICREHHTIPTGVG